MERKITMFLKKPSFVTSRPFSMVLKKNQHMKEEKEKPEEIGTRYVYIPVTIENKDKMDTYDIAMPTQHKSVKHTKTNSKIKCNVDYIKGVKKNSK